MVRLDDSLNPPPPPAPHAASKTTAPKSGGTSGGSPTKTQAGDQGAALKGQLLAGGYSFPFDISGIIDYAARHDLGASYVLGKVYGSPQFKAYFPGIFRHNGTLRMSPAEYLRYQEQSVAAAKAAGLNLTKAQVGYLISNEVSADEFAFRVKATQQIRANGYVFAAFNQILRSNRMKPIHNAQDAFNFLTGKADKTVYDTYEQSAILGAAKESGITNTVQQAKKLAAKESELIGFSDIEKSFKQLAADRHLGAPELSLFGLSTFDQEQVALGTANAATEQKYQQALKQQSAAAKANVAQPRVTLDSKIGERPVLQGGSPTPGA